MQSRKRKIWVCVGVLLIAVSGTVAVIGKQLMDMSQVELETVSLFPESLANKADIGTLESTPVTKGTSNQQATQNQEASVTVYDNQKTWSTKTDVEIFSLSYENGKQKVSVLSSNQEEVIAPGTENEYSFYLKNNGKTNATYQIHCEVQTSPGTLDLPVNISMKSYTGDYVVGSKDQMVQVRNGMHIQDEASLFSNHYAHYTLHWQWPFEQQNDVYDTYLGNRAVQENLSVKVIITTQAWSDETTPLLDGGLANPSTGDATRQMFYVCLGICAIVLVVVIVVRRKNQGNKEDE